MKLLSAVVVTSIAASLLPISASAAERVAGEDFAHENYASDGLEVLSLEELDALEALSLALDQERQAEIIDVQNQQGDLVSYAVRAADEHAAFNLSAVVERLEVPETSVDRIEGSVGAKQVNSIQGTALTTQFEGVSLQIDLSGDRVLRSDEIGTVTKSGDGVTNVLFPTADGAQTLHVLTSSSQSSFDVGVVAQPGYDWKLTHEGGVALFAHGAESPTVVADAPWAVDAAGKSLPTTYKVKDGRIVQTVETRGAVFPVVADPSWSWWAKKSAKCAAGLASFIEPTTLALKVAKVALSFKKLAKKSRAIAKAVSKLGGYRQASRKYAKFLYMKIRNSRVMSKIPGSKRLPYYKIRRSDRKHLRKLDRNASTAVQTALGVRSCFQMLAHL